jgi:hypothetical protein
MTRPPNITNITSPRVPFIDNRTGLISREWYRFLLNLFTLTGSGQSAATLEDLQLSPVGSDYSADIAKVQNDVGVGPLPVDYLPSISKILDEFGTTPPPIDYSASINNLRADLEIGSQPPITPPTQNYSIAPTAITVTASPFTYINQTGANADVIVSGGGISQLEFSRGGATFFSTGSFYGMFTLSPYDLLRVTYSTAPTMTLVPR